MSIELTLLIWSTTLVAVYMTVQALFYRVQHGVVHAASARDDETTPDRYSARAERALRNLLETYAVFVALAVATELTGRSDWLTQWGALLYFWGRWPYLPLYVFGVPFLRSAVWLATAAGLVMMFIGIAF